MTVTMASALTSVHGSAERLREAVQHLVLIAVEDRPRGAELHLTTIMHDAALDLAAEADHAAAVLRPDGPAGDPASTMGYQRILEYQAGINRLGCVLIRELATAERINHLGAAGAGHGREAGAWAEEIIRCIETCQHLLWTDVQPALLGYWQELTALTDRTGTPATDTELEMEGHRYDAH
jgi:hypothetical protein